MYLTSTESYIVLPRKTINSTNSRMVHSSIRDDVLSSDSVNFSLRSVDTARNDDITDWVAGMPLSKPMKHLSRDFSDGSEFFIYKNCIIQCFLNWYLCKQKHFFFFFCSAHGRNFKVLLSKSSQFTSLFPGQ